MSANLYETKVPGEYYHIHGSLEASTTLGMIGLEPYRPDLKTHQDIVDVIEGAVKKFSVTELEELNAKNRQAGVPALKHEEFLQTPHVSYSALEKTLGFANVTKTGKGKYRPASVDSRRARARNTKDSSSHTRTW
jgi:hypothetical protein